MHPFPARFSLIMIAAFCALAGASVSAGAGSLGGESIHSDSFGNLVVYSPAGYKRIVVGKGYLAHRMRAEAGAGFADDGSSPRVVYLDDEESRPTCHRRSVVVQGRSYMYGLDRNVTPVLAPCE